MAPITRSRPIAFWVTIVVVVFLAYSGAKAVATLDTCEKRFGSEKHWIVIPGEWQCGGGGVQLLRDGS